MATIKSYTDIEQSKKLAKILPIESADMVLPFRHTKNDEYIPGYVVSRNYVEVYNEMMKLPGMGKEDVCQLIQPAWSLAALLDVLPDNCGIDKEDGKYVGYVVSDECGTYTSDNPVDACVSMIEYLHELKESEDEKIKNEIINFIKDNTLTYTNRGSEIQMRWVDWLEKQGEQKNIEGTFINVDEVRENFVKEVYRVLANDTTNDRANDIIYYFDSLPTIYLHTNKPLAPDGDDFDMDDILKNHAWSEEDERLCQRLIEDQENIRSGVYEDKSNPSETISDLKEMYRKRISWLKSLKERYTWKPSVEQMRFLWKYAEQNNYDGTILTSLYQDLKKLRKE